MKKILLINASGNIGGDTAMVLLGLERLPADRYHVHAVTIPRGRVFESIKANTNTTIHEMELGGGELSQGITAQHTVLSRILRTFQTIGAIFGITGLALREQVDYIYTGDRTVSLLISYLVSLVTGRPLIINAQISHYLKNSLRHRLALKHAVRVTVSSNGMKERFLPYVRSPEVLVTIPNAIILGKYDPSLPGTKIRAEFDIPESAAVVAMAGRIEFHKGQEDFIRAADLILKVKPETYFLIAGDDYKSGYRAYLEQLVSDLGIGQRVKFIGFRQNIAEVFAAATLSAMPSHEEPFGLVALESMAMCKPVVATRAGGVPEYLIEGEMGYLVPPRDYTALARAVLQLIDNPEIAREMGIRGRRKVVEYYSDTAYAVQIEAVFSSLARSRPEFAVGSKGG
jgi:glycosyltransferase involved in cell wall biosynthesis